MAIKLSRKEALNRIEDGHAIWSKEYAEAICVAIGVDPDGLPAYKAYTDTTQANPKYNRYLSPGMEGTFCVDGEDIGPFIADRLGISGVEFFMGRGFQARAYARHIRQALDEQAFSDIKEMVKKHDAGEDSND